LAVIIATCSTVHAQRTLGVQWQVPNNTQTAKAELKQFEKLGITILQIDAPLSPALWQAADSLDFDVWGELGIRFPTATTFGSPDSALVAQIQNRASAYLSQPSVDAMGLFSFGATGESSFWEQLAPIASQIRANRSVRLYHSGYSPAVSDTIVSNFLIYNTHVTAATVDSISIPITQKVGGYLYAPSTALSSYLYPLNQFIDKTALAPDIPILVQSDWLLVTLERHPQVADLLQDLAAESNPAFALPEEDLPKPQSSTLPIIVLLVVWGSIAFHYHSSPIYRKSIFRYFSAHKFFVNDIFQRHIRSPLPAIFIILQTALLTAASVFAAFSVAISETGLEALFFHFPILTIWGNSVFALFIWAISISLLLSLVSILWLYLSHKSIKSLTQIATIYAWPLQLTFLLSTITITLFASGAANYWIISGGILTVLVNILSFVIAAGDLNRFSRSTISFLLKTTVLYAFLWIGVATVILLNNQWTEAISLAAELI